MSAVAPAAAEHPDRLAHRVDPEAARRDRHPITAPGDLASPQPRVAPGPRADRGATATQVRAGATSARFPAMDCSRPRPPMAPAPGCLVKVAVAVAARRSAPAIRTWPARAAGVEAPAAAAARPARPDSP